MGTRKIRITQEQLNRLIADLRAIPAEPVGNHLTTDEFVGYMLEELEDEEVKKLDVHLSSCETCCIEMERLLEGAEAWRGEEGEKRLANLSAWIQAQLKGG
ncbi:MAG: hypothetical protein HY377_00645 [Candidatus Blackburnbacteria bacterium]|nr:hypothetical protein [Candidatus Blackburnbacteria bacterium]